MTTLHDPGTPEARRAWLDSLPVGVVVVDGMGERQERTARGWRQDRLTGGGSVLLGVDGLCEWSGDDCYWPPRSVDLPAILDTTATAIAAWQAATFGAPGDPLTTLAKLRDEVDELHAELRQVPMPGLEAAHADRVREEAADVAFLLIDLMRGFGGVEALAAAMAAKLEKNKARTWARDASGKWSGSK